MLGVAGLCHCCTVGSFCLCVGDRFGLFACFGGSSPGLLSAFVFFFLLVLLVFFGSCVWMCCWSSCRLC